MTYSLLKFGTTLLPVYNPSIDIGTMQTNAPVINLPGGYLFDNWRSENAPPQTGKEISASYTLYDADSLSDIETQLNALKALRGHRLQLYRANADATVNWVLARLMEIEGTRTAEDNLCLVDIDMTYRTLSETWNGTYSLGWFLDDGWYFDGGLNFDGGGLYAIGSPTPVLTVNNAGNAPVRNVIFTITANAINITSITFYVSGVWKWTYSGTIDAGTSCIIDCGALTVVNDGVDDYDNFALDTSGNHIIDGWARLGPGNNSVGVTKVGGDTQDVVEIEFYSGWE